MNFINFQDWRLLWLLLGFTSSNLLPGDKRLGGHHHHHHNHHGHGHDADQGAHHHSHSEHNQVHHHRSNKEELTKHNQLTNKAKSRRQGKNIAIDFSQAELDQQTGLKCVR